MFKSLWGQKLTNYVNVVEMLKRFESGFSLKQAKTFSPQEVIFFISMFLFVWNFFFPYQYPYQYQIASIRLKRPKSERSVWNSDTNLRPKAERSAVLTFGFLDTH